MSWHFSQALEAAYSAGNSSAGGQSAPSSGTDMHGTFWSPGKTTDVLKPSRSGMTFKPLTDDRGEAVLMSYLEDFPVRTFHAPEKVQESKENEAPCGNTWRELSVKYCRNSSSWKTHQCLWEEDLEPSSLILPKWGMTRSGVLWERTTPAHLTSEIESGLSPNGVNCFHTPNTTGLDGGSNSRKALRKRQEMWPTPKAHEPGMTAKTTGRGVEKSTHLTTQVALAEGMIDRKTGRLWPTPRAGKTTDENEETWMIRHKAGKVATPPLSLAVKMWPTPTCQDAKNNGSPSQMVRNTKPLNAEVGGQLNPTWVEWLMGWPLGWTDCAASATDKFRQWLNSHGI
jgi:hypothetical protein